jgi:lysophospholipase L1-like esterase
MKISSMYFVAVAVLLAPFFAGCSRPEPKTIVCFGDSLTACGGLDGKYSDWLSKWLGGHKIINKGVGGDTLAGGRARFKADVMDLAADVVIIELGANDFWQQKRSIEQLKADLEDMTSRAKKAGMEVVIASCFGGRDLEKEEKVEFSRSKYDFGKAIAEMEQQICRRYDCFYVPNMQVDIKPNGKVPYWDDFNHPNRIGNEFVAKRILAELTKAIDSSRKFRQYH